jgi:predicted ATPase/DNA-binding SARP family transcriptional activator
MNVSSESPILRARFLGVFTLEIKGRKVRDFESDKARGLLAYLITEKRAFRREHLAGLFWADFPESRARGNLSRVLTNLRHLLPGYILSDRQTVGFDHERPYTCDVAVLAAARRSLDEGGVEKAGNEGEERLYELLKAARLYQGDFLAGLSLPDCPAFEEWLLFQREGLRVLALRTLARLQAYYLQRGAFETVLHYAQRSLELEPWQEQTHRQVMLIAALQGRREQALRQYDICRRTLQEELGMAPQPETMALYKRIKSRRVRPPIRLPLQPGCFVGREQELAEIHRRLVNPDCRLLTITGVGGIGKSRLAIEAAQRQAYIFLDGVIFTPLVSVETAALLPSAMTRALGIASHSQRTLQDHLLDYVRERRILFILDNFEHLIDGIPLLLQILQQAPDVKLLVTSRERLKVRWEWTLTLKGLPVRPPSLADESAAVTLFRARARQVRGKDESPHTRADVERICELVAGMPLGIELAASLADALALNEIAARIESDLGGLSTPFRDMPPRHQSLHAVFESAWRLLTPDAQRMLAALSVFRGSFAACAAAQVAGYVVDGADDGRALLESLVDQSLVYVHPAHEQDRYALHELTRQLAAEKLCDQGECLEAQARERHGLYYIAFLAASEDQLKGPEQHVALKRVELEVDNLRAAWRWTVDGGRLPELGRAAGGLARFYEARGWFEEGRVAFECATERAQWRATRRGDEQTPITLDDDERLIWARLLRYNALFHSYLGRIETCHARLVEALSAIEPLTPHPEVGATLVDLGLACQNLYRPAEAERLGERGLRILQRGGVSWALAKALNDVGNIYYLQGQYPKAKRRYAESVAVYEQVGDLRGVASALNNLGIIAQYEGDYAEAERRYHRSVEIKRAINDVWGIAISTYNIGEVLHLSARYADALSYLEEALEIFRDVGYRLGAVESLLRLGDIAFSLARYEEAETRYASAAAINETIDNPTQRALILDRTTRVALHKGELQEARRYLARAFSLPALPAARLRLTLTRAMLLAEEGQTAQAVEAAALVLGAPEALDETRQDAERLYRQWRGKRETIVAD